MPVINDRRVLENLLNSSMLMFSKSIGKDIQNKLIEYTKQNVYEDNEPSVYERTGEFLDSITLDNVKYNERIGEYVVSVRFAPEKMSLGTGFYYRVKRKKESPAKRAYGKHQSVYGEDIREALVGWIEDGTDGSTPNAFSTVPPEDDEERVGIHRYPERKGAHMIRDTKDWFLKNRDSIVSERLLDASSKYGFKNIINE